MIFINQIKKFFNDINKALNDFIIKKNIHSNFEIKHISSIDNIYSNSAVFINSNKEFDINEYNSYYY